MTVKVKWNSKHYSAQFFCIFFLKPIYTHLRSHVALIQCTNNFKPILSFIFICSYVCHPGFKIEDQSVTEITIKCPRSGKWKEPPSCISIFTPELYKIHYLIVKGLMIYIFQVMTEYGVNGVIGIPVQSLVVGDLWREPEPVKVLISLELSALAHLKK